MTIEQALEAIYTSLQNDNEDIDLHIKSLKETMKQDNINEAIFKLDRIPVNNREGRKTMQSYFKKRGVKVNFEQ